MLEFSWEKAYCLLTRLVEGRVLVEGFSRFSSFFMGVLNYSFFFFKAVNYSKKILRRLILDYPSMVLPWKLQRFRRTRRVFEEGSKPIYSGSSWSMNSSSSMSFISMEYSQSATQFFLFFSRMSSMRMRSIFFILYDSQRCCSSSSAVSVWIYRKECAGATVTSRITDFPLACIFASATLFLRPREESMVEKISRSMKCQLTSSVFTRYSSPSKAVIISLIVSSYGGFWFKRRGGSTSGRASQDMGKASSLVTITDSMKLGVEEYSYRVYVNLPSWSSVFAGL